MFGLYVVGLDSAAIVVDEDPRVLEWELVRRACLRDAGYPLPAYEVCAVGSGYWAHRAPVAV